MADIRINALATTAASTASDDFIAVDGSANGTRKLNAYSPTFGGNLTVSGALLSHQTGVLNLAYEGSSISQLVAYGADASTYGRANIVLRKAGTGVGAVTALSLTDTTAAIAGNLTVSGTGTSSVAGNFLVGTTTDGGQKLQVSGTATVSGNTTLTSTTASTSTTTGALVVSGGVGVAGAINGGGAATFSGKITAGEWLPVAASKIQTASTANNYVVTLANTASSGNGYGLRLHTNLTTSSDYLLVASSGADAGTIRFIVKSNGTINAPSLPTSASGLSAGDIWNDGGTLKIV